MYGHKKRNQIQDVEKISDYFNVADWWTYFNYRKAAQLKKLSKIRTCLSKYIKKDYLLYQTFICLCFCNIAKNIYQLVKTNLPYSCLNKLFKNYTLQTFNLNLLFRLFSKIRPYFYCEHSFDMNF